MKRKKKRKWIAGFLAIAMMLSLVKIPVHAATTSLQVTILGGTASAITLTDGQEQQIGGATVRLDGDVLTVKGNLDITGVAGSAGGVVPLIDVVGGTLTIQADGDLTLSNAYGPWVRGGVKIADANNVTLDSSYAYPGFSGAVEINIQGDLKIQTSYIVHAGQSFNVTKARNISMIGKAAVPLFSSVAPVMQCSGQVYLENAKQVVSAPGFQISGATYVDINAQQVCNGGQAVFDITGDLHIKSSQASFVGALNVKNASNVNIEAGAGRISGGNMDIHANGYVSLINKAGVITTASAQIVSGEYITLSANGTQISSGSNTTMLLEAAGDIRLTNESGAITANGTITSMTSKEGSVIISGITESYLLLGKELTITAAKGIDIKNDKGSIYYGNQSSFTCKEDIKLIGGNSSGSSSGSSVGKPYLFFGKCSINTEGSVVATSDMGASIFSTNAEIVAGGDVELRNSAGTVSQSMLTIKGANDVKIMSESNQGPALYDANVTINGNLSIESDHIAVYGKLQVNNANHVSIVGEAGNAVSPGMQKTPTVIFSRVQNVPSSFQVNGTVTITNKSDSFYAFDVKPEILMERYAVLAGDAEPGTAADETLEKTYTENAYVKILPKAPMPEFTVAATASTLTVNVDDYDVAKYGKLEYKFGDGAWTEVSKFTQLHSDTKFNMTVRCAGNDVYYQSDENLQECQTTPAVYTITIPKETLTAGDENSKTEISINKQQPFDLGYQGKILVKASQNNTTSSKGTVILTRTTGTAETISASLLVNGQVWDDLSKNIATFQMLEDAPVSVAFSKPFETDIPAGTYTGTVVYTVDYTEK